MIVLKENGTVDVSASTYTSIVDWYSGRALEALVNRGGTGLNATLRELTIIVMQKQLEELEAKKKEGQ